MMKGFVKVQISRLLASAFFLPNLLIPIIKNNREEKNNRRDIIIGYIFGKTIENHGRDP